MYRFYCPNTSENAFQTTIDDPDEIKHLSKVLRLGIGDKVLFFNGSGIEGEGRIKELSPRRVRLDVLSLATKEPTHPRIVLACAIPKKSKFEWILEKATELGVDEITPLQTNRTEVRIPESRLIGKQQRFQAVCLNASKQCKRSFLPQVHPPVMFEDLLHEPPAPKVFRLIPSLSGETRPIADVLAEERLRQMDKIIVAIGPEGDFTPEEYEQAHRAGWQAVTLGSTVLKVETAALMSLSCIRAQFDRR